MIEINRGINWKLLKLRGINWKWKKLTEELIENTEINRAIQKWLKLTEEFIENDCY